MQRCVETCNFWYETCDLLCYKRSHKWNVNELDECNENVCVNYNEKWWKISCKWLGIYSQPNQYTGGSGGTKTRVPPLYPQGSARSDSQRLQEIFPYLAMSNQVSSSQHTIDRVRNFLKCVRSLMESQTSNLSINAHDACHDVMLHFLYLEIYKMLCLNWNVNVANKV